MPIRVIHGNGDLIGAAFEGIGQGAQAFTDARNRDRVLDDQEARTAAYSQRITDARALRQAEMEMELDEREAEQRRQDALRQATVGMAGQRAQGLESRPGWTKDDEAGLRMIFADKSLTAKDQQRIADDYLDGVALRLEEEAESLERFKIGDRIQRAMQPGASGMPLIDEGTAQAYMERLEGGEPSWRVRADFDREIKAARSQERTEREMQQFSAVAEQAKGLENLTGAQNDLVDDITGRVEIGDLTPRQGMFQLRTVMNGDEDQLAEFAQLVAAQVAPQGQGQPAATGQQPQAAPEAPQYSHDGFVEFMGTLEGKSDKQKIAALKKYAKSLGLESVEDLYRLERDHERQMMLKVTKPTEGTFSDDFGNVHYPGGPPSGMDAQDRDPLFGKVGSK